MKAISENFTIDGSLGKEHQYGEESKFSVLFLLNAISCVYGVYSQPHLAVLISFVVAIICSGLCLRNKTKGHLGAMTILGISAIVGISYQLGMYYSVWSVSVILSLVCIQIAYALKK